MGYFGTHVLGAARFRTLTRAVIALVLFGAVCARPAVAATVLNLYTGNPTVNTAVQGLQAIAALVDKQSDGAVQIKIHLGGSLQIQIPDISQAVSDDVV